jgi:hypothetical protein
MGDINTTYKEFLDSLDSSYDPELKVTWVTDGRTNLDYLNKPEKERIGEKKSSSSELTIYDCLSAFSEEELLRGDNKWYC